MSALSWWRSWHGAPMDSKWPVVAARSGVKVGVVSAIVWALLDYASQHEERGTITGFDTEVYAVYSGFSEDEINAVIQAMTAKEIIVDGKFANWGKRQPKREDDSRDRVTKHRAMKRSVTQSNAPDTDTDTDTDTDKESDARADDFKALVAHFETTFGFPIAPIEDNIKTLNSWVQDGIEPQDLTDTAAFYSSNGRTARSPAQIDKSVRTAHAKRVQAESKSSTPIIDPRTLASEVYG